MYETYLESATFLAILVAVRRSRRGPFSGWVPPANVLNTTLRNIADHQRWGLTWVDCPGSGHRVVNLVGRIDRLQVDGYDLRSITATQPVICHAYSSRFLFNFTGRLAALQRTCAIQRAKRYGAKPDGRHPCEPREEPRNGGKRVLIARLLMDGRQHLLICGLVQVELATPV